MDLTIFEVDIDEPTLNAPFSGDKVVREPTDAPVEQSRGLRSVLVGLVGVATVGVGVFLWRRQDGTAPPTEPTASADVESETAADRGGLRSLIGLAFLCSLTAIVGHDETGAETASTGWLWSR